VSTNVFTDEMRRELLHHVPGLDYGRRHERDRGACAEHEIVTAATTAQPVSGELA